MCSTLHTTTLLQGANIVLKFLHGRSHIIQHDLPVLIYGWTFDDIPRCGY